MMPARRWRGVLDRVFKFLCIYSNLAVLSPQQKNALTILKGHFLLDFGLRSKTRNLDSRGLSPAQCVSDIRCGIFVFWNRTFEFLKNTAKRRWFAISGLP
jgi:hypothetical protein